MLYGKTFLGGKGYSVNHLKHPDYYSQDKKIEGIWVGHGCQHIGIEEGSRVSDEQFEALRDNKHPVTGKKLTLRNNRTRLEWVVKRYRDGRQILKKEKIPNRRAFTDITCSMPKTFSILGVTGGCKEVFQWHEAALKDTVAEMQEFCGRQDHKGKERWKQTANAVIARYDHSVNRCLEPQIHSHLIFFNVTRDSNGKSYSLDSGHLIDRVRYFTQVYRNRLAAHAHASGIEIIWGKFNEPQIKAIEHLIDTFSYRTQEIERLIDRVEEISGTALSPGERKHLVMISRGLDMAAFERLWASQRSRVESAYIRSGQDQSARVGLLEAFSRAVRQCSDATLQEADTDQVIQAQQSLLSASDQRVIDELKNSIRTEPSLLSGSTEDSVTYAIEHLFERKSVVRGWELLVEALNHACDRILPLDELRRILSSDPRLILKDKEYTTKEHLERERDLVEWTLGKGAGVTLPSLNGEDLGLSDCQKNAINELLGAKDRFVALSGKAGTGKSRSVTVLIKQNLDFGYQVLALAPSTRARDVIGAGERMTLQRFLVDPKVRSSLRPYDLVVLDEAGFASVEQVHALMKHALRGNWRVVFSGDVKQHVSVESGDAFRVLLSRTQIKREWLDKIVRQDPAALNGRYLRACKYFSIGKSTDGFAALDRAGAILVSRGPDRFAHMAQLVVSEQAKGKSVICVQPSHRENDLLNEEVRKLLKQKGVLGEERVILSHRSLGWTKAQKAEFGRYRAGMVLEVTRGKDKGLSWIVTSTSLDHITATREGVDREFNRAKMDSFEVCAQRALKVAIGDWLVTGSGMSSSHKGEILNGQRLLVAGFDASSNPILSDGSPVLTRNLTHGYASTSHKSQGDTCDHVIFGIDRKSVEWVDQKLAYVGATRGRFQITLFCESKASLLGIQKRTGDRKSALELVESINAMQIRKKIVDRIKVAGAKPSQSMERQTLGRQLPGE